MDLSGIYIKMSDCEEIQRLSPEFGAYGQDYFYHIYKDNDAKKFIRRIWLPRQDQIQEMAGMTEPGEVYLKQKYREHVDTWEKYWLAIYMIEEHNKIWDGEKWIKK